LIQILPDAPGLLFVVSTMNITARTAAGIARGVWVTPTGRMSSNLTYRSFAVAST
jgi:hypothetical protein